MYKVLIADDEKNIRLGIQAMVKREFPSFETIVAADGKEALEHVGDFKPDIVITDIKMPQLDGIQMIKELQGLDKKPSIVILSGYDDFAYAKEAIKNRVKDYLLKPVNRVELSKTINTIIEELEHKHKIAEQHLEDFRASQLNYILLNPNLREVDLEDLYQKMQMEPYPDGYFVGILHTGGQVEGSDLLANMNQLLSSDKGIIPFIDKDDSVVIISGDPQVFTDVKDYLGRERHIAFSIGVSGRAHGLETLKSTYEQAQAAMKYHFLFPRCKVILFDNVKDKPEVSELPVDIINKLSNMLGTDRDTEIKSNLLRLLDFDYIANNDITYLETLNKEINDIIFKSFFSKLGEESLETFKLLNKMGNIYNFDNFHDYFHALEDLIMRIHEYNKQLKSVYSEQKYMDKAITYIRENYHKDLNLAVVSNYISLNYSYFSHMFKEYTGQNFVDYLKMVRVEGAKQLLKGSDYKVLEISEMVGYKNPKQFARVFREIEGISPKEYRELN
ncbi:response regulator [Mesobacillus subterraneus]|uniref:Response regulator n=1 Tax=Mesobacillus subterraneus TaxID=285983 RepID=A0A427TRC2_9BACI|nr:response regulator [Mesobacillus subterraneus]RSD26801.1 response regulator [Mesobacillus subterraneus]